MFTCPECGSGGKRRPRSFVERVTNRAKLFCPNCDTVWYWRRVLFQKHVQCPDCGTTRLTKRSTWDRIDRKSDSLIRRALILFGAPIYHCTFCRLQFRDYHPLEAARSSNKARASSG